jgi:hypothetical protein
MFNWLWQVYDYVHCCCWDADSYFLSCNFQFCLCGPPELIENSLPSDQICLKCTLICSPGAQGKAHVPWLEVEVIENFCTENTMTISCSVIYGIV